MSASNQPTTGDALVQQTLTLTSLAILKVDIDERHRNYIDYLKEFVLSILVSHKPEPITDEIVAKHLENDFGLLVPIKGVQHVLRRLARKNLLRKEHGVFYLDSELPDIVFEEKRQEARVRIQRVYDALCKFVSSIRPEETWAAADASKAILGFLGRFAVDCLKSYVFNTALPRVPETKSKENYLVGRFLQKCYEQNPSLFEDFIVLVKGQMYANALTCPDLESLEKKFDRVTFFLDTPLVLNLLGLQGEGLSQAANELVGLILELKGKLAVFDHTLLEIHGVLKYVLRNLDDEQASSRILREIRSSSSKLSDLIILEDQLVERLSTNHIRVQPTPEYIEEVQIDEGTFEEVLADGVSYHRDHAIMNDINSVRSIYVLRQGVTPTRLEDAIAVFVTSNQAFAKTAFKFGKTHNSTKEVSSVITDYSLANVAWLKAPMKRPSLPEKETLAMCYAAMEPSKTLFNKYVQTMNILRDQGNISPEEHAILRLSPVAQRELMDITLGEEESLTGNSLKAILDRVKESYITEQKKTLQEERSHFESQLELATESIKNQKNKHEKEIEYQKELKRQSDEEKDRLLKEQHKTELATSHRAKSLAKIFIRTIMYIIIALLLLGGFASAGYFPDHFLGYLIPKWIPISIAIIAIIWGLYNWVNGKSLRSLSQKYEYALTLKIFAWLTGKPTISEPPS
jgi:hypothetical protein